MKRSGISALMQAKFSRFSQERLFESFGHALRVGSRSRVDNVAGLARFF